MTEGSGLRKPIPRWFSVMMLLAHLAWSWGAPEIHERAGHSDEAAWLPLFMMPTGVVGLALGIVLVAKPTRVSALMFCVVFAFHLAVGPGFHPR